MPARNRERIAGVLAWLLCASGVFFLFLGAREFWGSIRNQSEIAASWKPAQPATYPDLHRGDAVARLSFPRLEAQMFVVEGAGKKELRRGPGHLEGSALPGARGNCVIAGHRDTHFRLLKNIRKGDDIVLDMPDAEFLYRVKKLSVVAPWNTTPLQPTPKPVLSLITCYPFSYVGPAPKRLVVEAELAAAVTIEPRRPEMSGMPAASRFRSSIVQ